MHRPLEEMERVKVKGFSVLDEDFDFMAADLCSAVPEEPNKNKICESLGAVVKVVWSLWPRATRHLNRTLMCPRKPWTNTQEPPQCTENWARCI
jgi:hypothetical protein